MRIEQYTANWRLILRLEEERAARALLSRLEKTLGLEFTVTICEPFTETRERFDCVFATRHVLPEGLDLREAAETICGLLPGRWSLGELQVHEGDIKEVHCTTIAQDSTESIEWGHFWMRSQEVTERCN